jgi:hypothetical protein
MISAHPFFESTCVHSVTDISLRALKPGDAADVAGGDEIGRGVHNVGNLVDAQPQGYLRRQRPAVFLAQERISGFTLGIP